MSEHPPLSHPVLAPHVRFRWDEVRNHHQLVYPEGILVLNETAAAILELCDGRGIAELLDALSGSFGELQPRDVYEFLSEMAKRGFVRNADT